jgi:serine protease AprX
MKKILPAILFLVFLLSAQERANKCWIYFKDKGDILLSKNSVAAARSIGISERAIQRRAKMNHTQIEEEDFPVAQSYLDQLHHAGIVIQNTSRWFNAATAYLTDEQKKSLSALPFIKNIEPVRIFHCRELSSVEPSLFKHYASRLGDKYSYGPSFTQMDMIRAIDVHNIGISGRGVLVGMLDTGFRWREHEALQKMNVVGEYDFIQKDTITANGEGDAPSQDSHGTITMSLVGGYKEGQLVSPAFNASFLLAKTEYVPTETNVEEDNWVAAIEWMEMNGVDVVSSSLGYSEFDAGQKSYTYADMNGQTATTTKAAVLAARKGVVVVNAMGNEAATSWHYLTSPADADSIISVGAVQSNGSYAGFSSVGPTSDGRTKPDVVALGVGTYNAIPGKTAYAGSYQGTSLATPLVAGVAAQILSARPELTPVQVRDALRNTASNAPSPDNEIGWGIVNAYDAVLYHGMVISTDPEIALTIDSAYSISFWVISQTIIGKDSVILFYSTDNGTTFNSIRMDLVEQIDSKTRSGKYSAVLPRLSAAADVTFYVRSSDGLTPRTSPYAAPKKVYNTKQTVPGIPVVPPFPTTFVLKQNYPNPFNSTTNISYDLPNDDVVTLKVYDVLGKEIATLVNGFQKRKIYTISFNASLLSSGVYIYRLKTTKFSDVKKMVLVR